MLEFGPLGAGSAGNGLDPSSIGSAGGDWEESLDLDWLTDHEVRYLLPPTQRTRYQTKVFQQSVTLLIKLQPNGTARKGGGDGIRVEERGVGVGPWRVPSDQLPALVGVITGSSLLLLLVLSLLLYTVCHSHHHHTPAHKKYSVKSEVSSVTSGRTQGSPPSLSRESLLVITHAATGHQACLLPERDSPSDYIFECGCCCDPPCQLPCSCDCPGVGDEDEDDEEDEEEEEEEEGEGCSIEGTVFGDGDCSLNGSLPRSLSMPIKEQVTKEGAGDTQSPQNNNNNSNKRGSVRSKVSTRRPSFHATTTAAAATHATATHTTTVSFINCNQTLPRAAKRGSGGGREGELAGLPTCHEARLEEQRASSCGLDTVAGLLDGSSGMYLGDGGLASGVSGGVLDETYRTRSLPAWVRNKTRPLALLDDLNTIYEKPQWSKRRRNRMRSDAATVIALSKSRARLMSTGASGSGSGSGSGQGGTNAGTPEGVRTGAGQTEATAGGAAVAVAAPPQQPDTAALVENEAVIVYDERTAL